MKAETQTARPTESAAPPRPSSRREQKIAVFIEEAVICGRDFAEAYRRAWGYSGPNAAANAQRLLNRDPWIRSKIDERARQALESRKLTAERVIAELAAIAFLDPADLLETAPDGSWRLQDLRSIPAHARAGLKGLRVTKGGFSIRFQDKIEALKLLGDYLGLWNGKGAERQYERFDPTKYAHLTRDEVIASISDASLIEAANEGWIAEPIEEWPAKFFEGIEPKQPPAGINIDIREQST